MLCRPMSNLGSGRVSGSLQGRFFIFCGVTNTINTLSQCIVYMYQHCIKHIKHTNKHTNFCGVTITINSLSRCICAPSLHKKASEHTSQKRPHIGGESLQIEAVSNWLGLFFCRCLRRPNQLKFTSEFERRWPVPLYWAPPKLNTISMIRRSLMVLKRFFLKDR